VAVAGGYAYVADAWEGLRVVDVSTPSNPTEVGFYDTPGWGAAGVAVAGGYAYVADRNSGLRVVDVSNPSNPTEVGFYDTPGDAWGVAVAGGYAYIADGNSLRVVGVSNPSNPTEAGFYDTPAGGVAVAGHYVYVAAGDGGLVILWFAPPASASIPTSGGSLSSPTDNTTHIFPSGAFTDTVVITHTPRFPGNAPPPGNLVGIDHVFEVTAVYSDTGRPAQLVPGQIYTITVQYTDAEKGPAVEDTLALYCWEGSQWVKEATSVVNVNANTVTATPNHFSLWAVLGEETRRAFLPIILKNH
jgi:hypothetical protein